MSTTVIRKALRRGGILTDPYSIKLADPTGTYGVRRSDTSAVVVSSGTVMTQAGTGVYQFGFQDPAAGLTYEYYVEVVWSAGESPSYFEGTIDGGGSASGNLFTLKPLIIPHLPGCPEPVIEQQLIQIGREFCNQTDLWEEQIEIAAVVDQKNYALASSYDADVWRIRWVMLGLASTVEVPLPDQWGKVAPHRYDISSSTLILESAPNESGYALVVGARLVPRLSCTSYPDWMLEQYGPVLAAGTRFACMAMAGRPWSSPEGAQVAFREWSNGVGDATQQSVTKHEAGPVTVSQRRFF